MRGKGPPPSSQSKPTKQRNSDQTVSIMLLYVLSILLHFDDEPSTDDFDTAAFATEDRERHFTLQPNMARKKATMFKKEGGRRVCKGRKRGEEMSRSDFHPQWEYLRLHGLLMACLSPVLLSLLASLLSFLRFPHVDHRLSSLLTCRCVST